MEKSKFSYRSPSISSTASSQQTINNKLKPSELSDYEYIGRLVTRERPIIRKSNSVQQSPNFPPQHNYQYHHSTESNRRTVYEEVPTSSNGDNDEDSDGLSKPLGVVRISDRHFREIYRLPTPPPKVKRVYHRLQSPEPKVIERVFVRRPPPQIIENVIEIPPEKVRIINREKYLEKDTPITRSRIVRLKAKQHRRKEEQEQEQEDYIDGSQEDPQTNFIPAQQYPQQGTGAMPFSTFQQPAGTAFAYPQQATGAIPVTTFQQPSQAAATKLVYPPQSNLPAVGYIESTIPPHIMLNSKNPIQIPAQQIVQNPMMPPTSYGYPMPQPTAHQMVQPTPYNYQLRQPMTQPSPYQYQSQ